MKLSLIAAASLACLAAACGSSSEDAPRAPAPAESPQPEAPAPAPPPRQLVEGAALPTSPVNLLTDPGFSLVGQQAGFGSFLAFYDGSFARYELETTLDSRSPAGFGGAVALVRPARATDRKSDPVMLLTSFPGGKGPFRARVWVSKSDVKGAPVDLPTDGSAVTVSVTDGSPEGEAFDLKPVEGGTRAVGGRTWVLLGADVTKELKHGGFFVLRTGAKGGHIHIAAPEVTTDEIRLGQSTQSRGSLFVVKARRMSASERAAVARYKSLPPRLVPAGATTPDPRSLL